MTEYVHNLSILRRARPRAEVRTQLEALLGSVDRQALVAEDPLALVQAYEDPHDQEVAGLVVASLAYGRVASITAIAGKVLSRLGSSPARAADEGQVEALDGLVYRFQRGRDLPNFVAALGVLRRRHGSLARAFADVRTSADADLADTAARFVAAVRAEQAESGELSYGARYLLPDPASGGAAKRLLLYLRWMIRPADGLDLGTWAQLGAGLPPSGLVIPLDTHIARVARYLGFTRRAADDLRTAREITGALAKLDPEDPVRYDMALCHLGISGACPRRLDLDKCAVCPLREVCRVRPKRVRKR